MPHSGSETSYRVVGSKNRWEFPISLSLSRSIPFIVALMLTLGGCVEMASNLSGSSVKQIDLFDITGSLAGDRTGFSWQVLDDADRPRALAALEHALDPMNDGQPSLWTGQSGQSRGSFSARGVAFVHDEQLCRDFIASIENKRTSKDIERQQWPGTACRQGLGTAGSANWRVVESLQKPNRH